MKKPHGSFQSAFYAYKLLKTCFKIVNSHCDASFVMYLYPSLKLAEKPA